MKIKATHIQSKISLLWLHAKGYILSFYYHIWLSTRNFKKIKSLHRLVVDEHIDNYTEEEIIKIRQVSIVVHNVQKSAFWKPKCYNLALLAKKLLIMHKIDCHFKIGFRKRNNRIEGHAWIVCNKTVVSGYLPDLKSYNVLKPIKK